MSLSKKINFAVAFVVEYANPNGDPLAENRPRTTFDGFGEVSDVCIKRKMRNRIHEKLGRGSILVQSNDRSDDGAKSIEGRLMSSGISGKTAEETMKQACKKWFDVRAFGQLLAFSAKNKKKGEGGVSIGIRGPVTVTPALSVEPVEVEEMQITKSTNASESDGDKKGSDTMGRKYRVKYGVYFFFGTMNPVLAEKTGFSDKDAETIKEILPKLFENDASSARPEGSMYVTDVLWWKHSCRGGDFSSRKVMQSFRVNGKGEIEVVASLDGLKPEHILPL